MSRIPLLFVLLIYMNFQIYYSLFLSHISQRLRDTQSLIKESKFTPLENIYIYIYKVPRCS